MVLSLIRTHQVGIHAGNGQFWVGKNIVFELLQLVESKAKSVHAGV